MKQVRLYGCALAAVAFLASGAWGQSITSVLKAQQRWTPPLASHSSRVELCENPLPLDLVALDDWVCPQSGPIIRLVWWGVLLDFGQRDRQFYVAIYLDNGNCQPGDLLYEQCVTPRAKIVGKDCKGNRVWRFTARLPVAFIQTEGQHYWLQISEDDERSIRPGVEDFQWSAHRPIEKCPAVQRDASGAFITPLLDGCDDKEDDLAFALWSRAITGTITFPDLTVAAVLRLELYDPASGDLLATSLFESATPITLPREGGRAAAVDSFFDVFTELSDGTYDYRIVGMGMEPIRGQLTLTQGEETQLPAVQVKMGDLNGDCRRNVVDLLLLLGGWGDCVP